MNTPSLLDPNIVGAPIAGIFWLVAAIVVAALITAATPGDRS